MSSESMWLVVVDLPYACVHPCADAARGGGIVGGTNAGRTSSVRKHRVSFKGRSPAKSARLQRKLRRWYAHHVRTLVKGKRTYTPQAYLCLRAVCLASDLSAHHVRPCKTSALIFWLGIFRSFSCSREEMRFALRPCGDAAGTAEKFLGRPPSSSPFPPSHATDATRKLIESGRH